MVKTIVLHQNFRNWPSQTSVLSVMGTVRSETLGLRQETLVNTVVKSGIVCGGLYAPTSTMERRKYFCIGFGKEMNSFESPWPGIGSWYPSKIRVSQKEPGNQRLYHRSGRPENLSKKYCVTQKLFRFLYEGERTAFPPLFSGSPRQGFKP